MSGGIAAALLLGVTIATWQAVRASRAEAVALAERNRAEEGFRRARQAVDEYFTTVSESTLFDVPGLQPLRKQLLESALRYYQDFLQERGANEEITAEVAATWHRVAMLTKEVGEPQEAQAAFEEAHVLYEHLVAKQPMEARFRVDLAICCNDFGNIAQEMGDWNKALELHQQARDLREQLVAEHPHLPRMRNELAKSLNNIARCLQAKGAIQQAIELTEQSNEIHEAIIDSKSPDLQMPTDLGSRYNTLANVRMDLAIGLQNLGELTATSDWPRAAECYDRSRQMLEALLREQPGDLEAAWRLIHCCNLAAGQLAYRGKLVESDAVAERSRQVGEDLVLNNPAVPRYQEYLAASYTQLGSNALAAGRPAEAIIHHGKAASFLERVITVRSDLPYLAARLARAHLGQAQAYQELAELDNAEAHYRQAIDISTRLTEDFPEQVWYVENVITSTLAYAELLHQQGRSEEAGKQFELAHGAYRELIGRDPGTSRHLNNFAWHLSMCPDERLVDVSQALSTARKAVEMEPENGIYLSTMGTILYQAGEYQAAVDTLTKAARLRNGGDSFEFFFLAMACWQLDRREEARAWFGRAVKWMDEHKPVDRELCRFRAEATELIGLAGASPTALAPDQKQ